ncbi:T9SS type A sorting domain-containing protein [Tamlana agarivorans]|uniref:T9SS type A sorting domain-containing protein n=2 Tax=Pseudotamlana agarivorans TaxID=481183 RepID=A0ACC5U6K2_9FLAO|nr:T9SS type A sorting domain-containing protein [Tamlana agarivorans]
MRSCARNTRTTFNLLFLFLFASQFALAQQIYTIDDPEDIRGLSATLVPGDIVELKDGVYNNSGRMRFGANGTKDNPIIFRAQTPGGVTFTNGARLSISGDYVVVDGFYWKGGYGASAVIEFRDSGDVAYHSTIQNCAMDGLIVDPSDEVVGQSKKHNWIKLYGNYNSVINCSFMNKKNAGALILVELYYNITPDGGITNTQCDEVGHTISNNYFYNFEKIDPTLTNAGDSETIRIGVSGGQMVNANCVVNNNYFVKSDGENEIITNKSKGNSYINNTFRECRGSLVLRHGSNATVDGNFFLGNNVEGTGGIRIVDSDHSITNNYIQDCVTTIDQAKWNNGITFIGGEKSSIDDCMSTSSSSDYQESKDITLSNNTIVNTNAPLFYNIDKGDGAVTGTMANNLIYFSSGNINKTDVIVGETATAFSEIGQSLMYSGNVYAGTDLGESDANTGNGFSLESGITATPDGEIFTFSGATGKGADMGAYEPATDAKVGFGIGACFLNSAGTKIINGDCNIVIQESLLVSTLPSFTYDAGNNTVDVTANVSWTAASNDSWVTIDTNAGSGDATVLVTVTKNTSSVSRTGTVTFTQDPGGDDIVRTLTINQEAPSPTDLATLINDQGNGTDGVTVHSFSMEQVTSTKSNYAVNVLDKDQGTNWSSDGTTGGDSFIIIDLGAYYDLEIIDFASTNGKTYDFQLRVSNTGVADGDFTDPFGTGNLISSNDNTFKSFVLPSVANGVRFVKILGFGQPNGGGSDWTSITELEFYGDFNASLSTEEQIFSKQLKMYPVPAKEVLNINTKDVVVNNVSVYGLDGRLVLNKSVGNSNAGITLNTSSLSNGTYVIRFTNTNGLNESRMIVVSH